MSSDGRDTRSISEEGRAAEHQTVAEGRILRGKNFVIGCAMGGLTILLLFGAKVALDVYERQSRVTSERIQVLEGDLREYSKLDLNLNNLSREILGIQERMGLLDEQLGQLAQRLLLDWAVDVVDAQHLVVVERQRRLHQRHVHLATLARALAP